ncbi:MAG: DNA-3-methyladenine glycosylase [Deltaproteobacteria bacterium]|nr:DNA-3-methyladenine glycosylase [Deltaproteobacteria bacterium]
MASPGPLAQSFYARDARAVAAELIGCRFFHRLPDGTRLVLRLVEVEAYLGDGSDPASHAHRGPTPRNRAMFGPPGRLYAYRSYGIHTCVNVVCSPAGHGAAVLLRAGEPVCGDERMRALRALDTSAPLRAIASGPGRLAQALGLTLEHDGASLLRGALGILPPAASDPAPTLATGARVGITQAADLPYRYSDAASACVSAFRSGGKRARGARGLAEA